MDDAGNIIYHPQQQLLYAGLKSEDTEALAALGDGAYADDTVIYSIDSVGESGWRAVGVSYVDELVNRNVNDMIRLSLWLAVVVLAVAVLTSWLLSRLIGKPLRGLASAMESFESDADHFTYRPVGGTREVQELSDSFEHMVLRIQELMTTVREEEVNLRKTELKALQAQINPHFLYNTLDSIAWMCEQGRNADAVKMVHALARLFRISISRGHELIPIAKELEHAESYLQIQMYRYKNQFTYTFDVDPDCLDYYCNKITLQPIIENSINHGLDLMVDEGRIDVRVRFDGDDIVFSVQDNGVGMSPEQLEAIMQHGPTDRTGIGIKNVNDRLKIYFGKNYGLHITSEPDVGTCVEIRMPRIREGDYETK
jgi:two-component system sensor histidine kinase YesM